jgi:pyrroline-5-carboxylate reductase
MKRIGFIGYGSMAKMLISGLIRYGNIDQEQIVVTRKDKNRLAEIRTDWDQLRITKEISDVIRESEYIFICVKPMEYIDVLKEMKPWLQPNQHIISIAGSVMIEDMERMIDCKISKLLPTVVNEVQGGIALICHSSKVGEADRRQLEDILGCISELRHIKEEDFGFASEFTSCGPGLYAAIFQEFVEAGLRHGTSFTKEEINDLVLHTLIGTSKLMLEEKMDFAEVMNRVQTKGGITEVGVRIIREELPQVFDEAFDGMLGKRKLVYEKLHKEFDAQ